MKKVVILGSTGSVGVNALRVIARHRDAFKVVGLTANTNAELLAGQANSFKPRLLGIGDPSQYARVKSALKTPKRVLKGIEGLIEIASMKEADIVLVAMSGTACIRPLIAAIGAKKRIALANKEAIVSAGPIVMGMARSLGVEIIPVDSEHNSIFQCIRSENKESIKKIFLMGTGGPLKNIARNIFDRLNPSRILAHPIWKMGKKISVDSATMMNKGLEVIEASYLFGMDTKKIEVLLHPEAIIHSMVEFKDGNIMANLFYPDMRFPIFYALNYPERRVSHLPRLDFSKMRNITFDMPNHRKFPALELCYYAARRGGTYPAALNSANEEAVKLYLEGKIRFTRVVDAIKKVLKRHKNTPSPSIGDILNVDRWAKEEVKRLC
ncbi:MAG: 1-deoxy-D-xylulose-5-phosphate reductoisomerase [Omnitrophica bacterium]|nr:1-deoxy-D-xylulose-5-phosphate reductoisomerase [Candidatus Omnitrophota bacterium]